MAGTGSMTTLQEWKQDNLPEPPLLWATEAREQMSWFQCVFAYMVWNSCLSPVERDEMSFEERLNTMTVDGMHTSKSVLLPVYRMDVGNVVIKVRGNFHDYCVQCWPKAAKPFPEWMAIETDRHGYFEGMTRDSSATEFCVQGREQLYAAVWWLLNEGIK